MSSGSKALRYIAFGLMTVFAVVGGAFIIGETMTDPGGTVAVALNLSWLVPMIAFSVFALYRPQAATTTLTIVAVVVACFVVLDALLRVVPRDQIGPVGSIAVFAAAVALGCLGLHRPRTAGLLLLLLGAAGLTGGGSGIAVAVPVLVVAGLYLLADRGQSGQNTVKRPPGKGPDVTAPIGVSRRGGKSNSSTG